jgi:hypothetical protein
MPRLPRLTPQAALPSSSGSPTIDIGGAGANAATVARAALGLSGAIATTAGHLLAANDRAERHRQTVEAEKRKMASAGETASLVAGVEESVGLLESDLQATVLDPDQYTAALNQGLDRITAQARQSARYPETQQALSTRLPAISSRAVLAGRKRADALFENSETEIMESTLDTAKRLAADAPIGDEETFWRRINYGMDAITARQPMLGHDKAYARAKQFQEEALATRAATHKDTDPAGFLRDIEQGTSKSYQMIDPEKRRQLVAEAQNNVITLAREARIQQEHRDKQLAEIEQKNKAKVYLDLEVRANDRTLPLKELKEYADRREIVAAQYQHLYTTLTAPPKDSPSQRPLLDDFRIDASSSQPQLTEADARRAMELFRITNGAAGLNNKDGVEILQKLVSRNDHLQDKAKAAVKLRHDQAEQELRAAIGVPSIIDEKFDARIHRTWGLFLEELRRASTMFDGTKDPLVALESIKPRAQKAIGEVTKMILKDVVASIPPEYHNRVGVENAFQAGRMTEADRKFWHRRIDALEEASKKAGDAHMRQQENVNPSEIIAPSGARKNAWPTR